MTARVRESQRECERERKSKENSENVYIWFKAAIEQNKAQPIMLEWFQGTAKLFCWVSSMAMIRESAEFGYDMKNFN